MQITRIEIENFRNHQHLVLEDVGNVLVIVGNNAVGKTNVIEALQLLSVHESFRRPKAEELVYRRREEGSRTLIRVDLHDLNSTNTKQIVFIDNSRSFSYNGKIRPARELADLLPAVLFTPDDLQIIKGPPEQRRDMLDSLGSRLSKTFAQIRSEYYKVLRQKNSLLRQKEGEVDDALLDSWNTGLARSGAFLSKHRMGLFKQLLEHAAVIYRKISGGEELSGKYLLTWDSPQEESSFEDHPSSDFSHERSSREARVRKAQPCGGVSEASDATGPVHDKDERRGDPRVGEMPENKASASGQETEELAVKLYEALFQKRNEEISAKRSLIGPHRDDVSFTIDRHDTRRFASQGQQRSIALALKMAEIEILRRVSGKDPLLLLDDVMSELDTSRRRYFIDLIGSAGQTVITTTNLSYFEEEFLSRATVVELKGKLDASSEDNPCEAGNPGR